MNSTSQNSHEHIGTDMELPPNPATELTGPPKTAAGPFWEQCNHLWTSISAHPLLPDGNSHRVLLSNLQNLYPAVHHVISSEITPATALDHSVLESVRVFVVEHLSHIARALDILARKLDMHGAGAVRGFLAADEVQGFAAWVDGLVEQETDHEKVWDVCGYCLLQAVNELYGIFPMLRRVQVMYQTSVMAS